MCIEECGRENIFLGLSAFFCFVGCTVWNEKNKKNKNGRNTENKNKKIQWQKCNLFPGQWDLLPVFSQWWICNVL